MNIEIMRKLYKLSEKAYKNGDIPVSCIILKEKRIIAAEYNKKYIKNDPTAHAEILAIKKACKKLKTNNLMDCELYVTLYPCEMCKALINEVRLKKVYFILNQEKNVNNTATYEKMFVKFKKIFKYQLQSFFYNKR